MKVYDDCVCQIQDACRDWIDWLQHRPTIQNTATPVGDTGALSPKPLYTCMFRHITSMLSPLVSLDDLNYQMIGR